MQNIQDLKAVEAILLQSLWRQRKVRLAYLATCWDGTSCLSTLLFDRSSQEKTESRLEVGLFTAFQRAASKCFSDLRVLQVRSESRSIPLLPNGSCSMPAQIVVGMDCNITFRCVMVLSRGIVLCRS